MEEQIEHKQMFIPGNTEQVENVSLLLLGDTPFRSQFCFSLSLPLPSFVLEISFSAVYRIDAS